MQMTDKERAFLARRARLMRSWPVVGGLLLVLVIALGVWLFFFRPLLANPLVVMSALESNTIEPSSLTVMAGLLPVTVLVCLGLALAVVLFSFAAFNNEKKYLALIRQLEASVSRHDASSP
jgi:hypothetical protein